MRFVLHSAIAAAALAVAAPASAAIIFDFNTGLLTVDSTTTVGDSTTIDFSGFAPNTPPIPGLTSSLTLTFQGLSGNNYLFDYLLTNTSTSPIDASRVTVFGFTSITPNPTSPILWSRALSGQSPAGISRAEPTSSFAQRTGRTTIAPAARAAPVSVSPVRALLRSRSTRSTHRSPWAV